MGLVLLLATAPPDAQDQALSLPDMVRIASVVGTFLVILVALFGEGIKYRLGVRPRLKLEVDRKEGKPTTEGSTPLRYYHLRVTNERPWVPAENVIVIVQRVESRGKDGYWRTVNDSVTQLQWQRRLNDTSRIVISFQNRICDLLHVKQGRLRLSVGHVDAAKIGGQLTDAGDMRVYVAAEADNGRSPVTCLEVCWNGEFADGDKEMTENLKLSVVNG